MKQATFIFFYVLLTFSGKIQTQKLTKQNMKSVLTLFYIFLLGLISVNAQSQNLLTTVVNKNTYFTQDINIEKFAAKRFQFKAAIKVQAATDTSAAAVIVLVRKKDNSVGFHTNIQQYLKKNPDWETTNIEGMLDSNAKVIEIGGFCSNDGIFSFDDFQLKVETSSGNWESVSIDNGGFEKGKFDNWVTGTIITPLTFDGAKYTIEVQNSFEGKYHLKIDCKYINYGNNDKAGKFATVNGIKLYYEIYGEGKPLLLLHGNGGSIVGHSVRIADFKHKYKVIAADSRAQGKSGDNGQELTYDLMADDINKLLEQLHIDSAYIWGQSDGGIIGLILSMKYPHKVKKLAVWGANIQADTNALFPKIYEGVVEASKNSKNKKDKQLSMLMAKYPNIPFTALNSINAPVLVMSGDRDAIQLEHTIKIFQNIPNSQLFIMPGTTHYGAYEKSSLFNLILSEFFDKPFKKPSTAN